MKTVDAPWTLHGRAVILLYRLDAQFVERNGFLPPELRGKFSGNVGAVMIVDYADSPAGPYDELLFIPGQFKIGGHKGHSITRIFVSTELSKQSGRKNWGVPKETAKFDLSYGPRGEVYSSVSDGETTFFEATVRSRGPRFPLTTALYPVALCQPHDGRLLKTAFSGSGKARFAKLERLQINGAIFPDLAQRKPLLAVVMETFQLTFPRAEVHRLSV